MSSFTRLSRCTFQWCCLFFYSSNVVELACVQTPPVPSQKIEERGGVRLYTGYVESVRKRTLRMSDQIRCLFYSDLN